MANKKKNHTANHIISTFLMSNRSLKKIYKLNATRIALIRYICDSIDMNFNKRKSLSTKLYQTQIAKHCHLERRTAGDHLKIIIKKRFLNWNENTHIYTLGKVLSTWGDSPHQIEVGRIAPYLTLLTLLIQPHVLRTLKIKGQKLLLCSLKKVLN